MKRYLVFSFFLLCFGLSGCSENNSKIFDRAIKQNLIPVSYDGTDTIIRLEGSLWDTYENAPQKEKIELCQHYVKKFKAKNSDYHMIYSNGLASKYDIYIDDVVVGSVFVRRQ
jgi:hypothetical protein